MVLNFYEIRQTVFVSIDSQQGQTHLTFSVDVILFQFNKISIIRCLRILRLKRLKVRNFVQEFKEDVKRCGCSSKSRRTLLMKNHAVSTFYFLQNGPSEDLRIVAT